MAGFKDCLNCDMTVFFNDNEFAEVHDIDGLSVLAIVDSDILKTRTSRKAEEYDGVYAAEVAVYVKAIDLPVRPVYGQAIRLDGKLYTVVECSEEMGVLEIVLGANES